MFQLREEGGGGRGKGRCSSFIASCVVRWCCVVERMLDYDPATRIKPMQALNHPFLREEDVPSAAGGPSTMSSGVAVEGMWG